KAARKALRPSQRQSVLDARTVDTIEKKEMRTTMLDEVYEEALESTAARLKSKPARFEVVEASMNTVVIDLRVRFMKKNLHIVARRNQWLSHSFSGATYAHTIRN
ncbi:hypothetical protein CYMTET_42179, partial [Cymbomonas tetramitiformis]